jgi:hypothetical protein
MRYKVNRYTMYLTTGLLRELGIKALYSNNLIHNLSKHYILIWLRTLFTLSYLLGDSVLSICSLELFNKMCLLIFYY